MMIPHENNHQCGMVIHKYENDLPEFQWYGPHKSAEVMESSPT